MKFDLNKRSAVLHASVSVLPTLSFLTVNFEKLNKLIRSSVMLTISLPIARYIDGQLSAYIHGVQQMAI